MALHLFPTPIECKQCGATVDDDTVDRCPTCGDLLKERRTPSRLAGVERKYENFRLLLGFLRFLGISVAILGVVAFFFSDAALSVPWRLASMVGAILVGVLLMLVAAALEIVADLEENSRATFRVLLSILDQMRSNAASARARTDVDGDAP